MKVGLVDYGAGNLRSVANALRALGQEPLMVSNAAEIGDATHLLLPGVGSFGDCMAQLEPVSYTHLTLPTICSV